MYSAQIVARSEAKLQDSLGIKLVRYSVTDSISRADSLQRLAMPDGNLRRPLALEEKQFIRNERLLCTIDFRYWLERYVSLIADQGGLTHPVPWASQEILLARIAKLQQAMDECLQRKEPVDGIMIALHKARQLGATAIGRSIVVHRLTLAKYTRSMSASLDDDKVMELYDRDKLILDNLPWFLLPAIKFDEKAKHIVFDKLGSRVIYQTSNQKFGVGQGRQFDVNHLTECASWEFPLRIEHDFFPTIPHSVHAFCLLESTAQGRGNWWHEFVGRIRTGASRRFHFLFIPWYTEPSKYIAQPPLDWKPSDLAMKHAQRVYETSPELVGHATMLSRQQLYWWESTRNEYQAANSLNVFYTNYPSTPEESFQHSTRSAFSFEYLEQARMSIKQGTAYQINEVRA